METKTKTFFKRLDRVCRQFFRVIKVAYKKEKNIENLYIKWNNLRKKEDETSKDECKKIENKLRDSYSKEYIDRIEKGVKKY